MPMPLFYHYAMLTAVRGPTSMRPKCARGDTPPKVFSTTMMPRKTAAVQHHAMSSPCVAKYESSIFGSHANGVQLQA